MIRGIRRFLRQGTGNDVNSCYPPEDEDGNR